MFATRSRIHVLAASLACATTACCGGGAMPPKSQFPTAEDAFARMKATYACVNGVQGQAKIDSLNKQGRIRGDIYILAQNPDRVRFEVVSPFGPTLFLLTSDGKQFELLDVKDKQFLYGPPKACNLQRMTQVPVPGHAMVSLLRGEAPILSHKPEQAKIAWDPKGYFKVLVDGTSGGLEEIHLAIPEKDFDKPWSEQRVRVLDVRVAQMNVDLYHAELANHAPVHTAPPRVDEDGVEEPIPPTGGVCDAELPRSLHITVPGSDQDVIFQYKDADKKDEPHWNPPIVTGAFHQADSGGVSRGYVDCDDAKK